MRLSSFDLLGLLLSCFVSWFQMFIGPLVTASLNNDGVADSLPNLQAHRHEVVLGDLRESLAVQLTSCRKQAPLVDAS